MDLKIASALVGDPYPGQEVAITVKGQEYRFAYELHQRWENDWRLVEQDGDTVRRYFPRLGEDWETPFDPGFFQIYLTDNQTIAIEFPLFLKAVPRGMALCGDRADACLGRIESIVIL